MMSASAASNGQRLWQSTACTHPGNRRSVNQDAVVEHQQIQLWAVADGMGGHAAGEQASRAIACALGELHPAADLVSMIDQVEDTLLSVNDLLRHWSRAEFQGETIGSTVVTLTIRDSVGVALWAGDSRLYRLRAGKLEQITRDHNPIGDLLELGTVSEEEALSADTNIVTRAVGGQSELHLDCAVFDVDEHDTFLLCSDGLYREVAAEQMLELLSKDIESAAAQLLKACLACEARDNVSLVIVRNNSGEVDCVRSR